MKRILFISPSLAQGGAERQIVTIARLLKERGYNVEFLCYSDGNFYAGDLNSDKIHIKWIISNGIKRLILCMYFIITHQFDVVISFLPTPSVINNFSSLYNRGRVVITGERSSRPIDKSSAIGKIRILLQRRANFIVCNSNNSMNIWRKGCPQLSHKLKVIYNTVTLGNVTSNYVPRKHGKVHICIAATIYGIKNPIGLINALLLMNEEEKRNIQIDWYGKKEAETGKHEVYDQACKLIKINNLQNLLVFHQESKDIANIMNQSDCVALFSQLEGLPNAICEGMMLKKPIIMTRVSDYNNLVKEGDNGFLCNWDDPHTIKEALIDISRMSAQELIKMGENSYVIANRLFSENSVINSWIKLIEQ